MLKAIFFDAVGTLIFLPRTVGEHYAEIAARFGASLDAPRVDQSFRAAWANSADRVNDHRPRHNDDKGWWRDLVDCVLADVLTPTQRKDFDGDGYFEAVYAHFAEPGVWAVYPEVFEVLGALRARRFALGVISNFDGRLRVVLAGLELTGFFDHIVISSELGADKPDPFIFRRTLEIFGVGPDEAMHAGDDPRRDGGAAAIGLRVFQLDRPRGTLRGLLAMIDGQTGS